MKNSTFSAPIFHRSNEGFDLSRKTCNKWADFLFDCQSKGRVIMDCTVVQTEDGCNVDCECTGNGGSDKRRF